MSVGPPTVAAMKNITGDIDVRIEGNGQTDLIFRRHGLFGRRHVITLHYPTAEDAEASLLKVLDTVQRLGRRHQAANTPR